MTQILNMSFDVDNVSRLRKTALTQDWPIVYILSNSTEAYIGETVSAHNRLRQHLASQKRKDLTSAHIIIDGELNKSASLDIESWLIQYMSADSIYELQNSNKGISNHSYYDREKYIAKFEALWPKLQKLGLAKSDLVQLRNSDIFKYSPYKALTNEQMQIVKHISGGILNNNKTYLVHGEPGTGKSILATYLTKYLVESKEHPNIKIALVIPMAGLRTTLKRVFKKVKGLDPSMVISPSQVMGQSYDLLIVDEAHRLRQRKNLSMYKQFDDTNRFYHLDNTGTQLDWILQSSKSQVLLFDKNQSVMPGDIPSEKLINLNAENLKLTSQLRVKGGDNYISFVDNLMNNRSNLSVQVQDYDLRCFDTIQELLAEIKKRESEVGLSRTVAGYAWDWKTRKGKANYDIDIDGLKLVWNSTNIDWVNSRNAINEIGCIHTIQGYDLNYVGVIMGPEITYNKKLNAIEVDKDKYKDINGKRSMESSEELIRYVTNIYKTLLTRGIHGTYIYACNLELRKYVKSNINSALSEKIKSKPHS